MKENGEIQKPERSCDEKLDDWQRLRGILGSLMVAQFKSQNEYQDAINQIIYHFFHDLTKAGQIEDNDKPCDTE